MDQSRPPAFSDIADPETRSAFLGGYPEVVRWLEPSTRLFKWTESMTSARGVSPWWMFLQPVRLATGSVIPGIQELQDRASRMGVHDRDLARSRLAVTKEWNRMTSAVAVSLTQGMWGYIGKASGQRRERDNPNVLWIGGEYQVWIPRITIHDVVRISIVPYLKPNAPFGAR